MTPRRTPDGALTDDATDAARTAHEAGHRVDHDAGLRQARTALSARRRGMAWCGTWAYYEDGCFLTDARADREDERRRTRAQQSARDHLAAPDLPPLPLDQLVKRHETGRLVTAYTKRLIPMRSAASCSAIGSL